MDRFLEEVLELLQALGYDKQRIPLLIDYVYGRPAGQPVQEVGGTMVTFAALCEIMNIDMKQAGEDELYRCWENLAKIRAKQAAKKEKLGPLP